MYNIYNKYIFWIMHPTTQMGALSKREALFCFSLSLCIPSGMHLFVQKFVECFPFVPFVIESTFSLIVFVVVVLHILQKEGQQIGFDRFCCCNLICARVYVIFKEIQKRNTYILQIGMPSCSWCTVQNKIIVEKNFLLCSTYTISSCR